MSSPPALPESDDDDLGELPPLDGDTDEGDPSEGGLDILDDGAASLDDSTGEDDPADASELNLPEVEASWLNDSADATDLDLGDAGLGDAGLVDLDERQIRPGDVEEPDIGDEDVGLSDLAEYGMLDAGDEGPLDPDEELRDEDLPELDADDEDPDSAGYNDEPFAADESLGLLPWAARPWDCVGAPLGLVAATAVACVSRGALVAARAENDRPEVFRVDLEGAREILTSQSIAGADVASVAAEGQIMAVVLRGGALLVSRDGGERFGRVVGAIGVADAVLGADVLWVRTRGGDVLVSSGGDRDFARCPLPGSVAAIARNGVMGVVALVVDDAGRPVALARGGPDGVLHREAIDAPLASSATVLAARSSHVAYSGRTGVVRRGTDGVWRSFAWGGRITALAFVDDEGTLLVATYADADDTTGLVCLDVAGRAAVVARLGAVQTVRDASSAGIAGADGRTLALACDDSRGVVWVAGGFGLAAFAIDHPKSDLSG
jgi:hypothetical protein